MCIFCAAIPATAALGAAVHGKQAEARRRADDSQAATPTSNPVRMRQLPIAALTGVVVAGLIVGSVVTHVATASG